METPAAQILIVEDDENIAKMIKVSLSLGNYKGTICGDGNQVMDYLRDGDYQLILLDIMLPGKDGFQLMEEIEEFNQISKDDILAYQKKDFEWEVLVADKEKAAKKYKKCVIDNATIDEIYCWKYRRDF